MRDQFADFELLHKSFDSVLMRTPQGTRIRTQEGWWGTWSEEGDITEITNMDAVKKYENWWHWVRLVETAADLTEARGAPPPAVTEVE